jgi:hypothetical protein
MKGLEDTENGKVYGRWKEGLRREGYEEESGDDVVGSHKKLARIDYLGKYDDDVVLEPQAQVSACAAQMYP